MFTPADEHTHAPRLAHRYWSESYYFSFLDAAGGWGGAARVAFSPNQNARDGFLILFFPDGKAGFVRLWQPGGLPAAGEGARVEALGFACDEPFQRWRLRYEGPVFVFDDPADAANFYRTTLYALPTRQVKLDLTFACYHAPFDFHDAMRIRLLPPGRLLAKLRPAYFVNHFAQGLYKLSQARTMGGASHYEQAGHVTGTLTVDGRDHALTGTGQRDHSWGVRDMRVLSNWQWFSCQFGDELAFNATRVELLGFAAVGGHAYYQGECRPLRNLKLEIEYDPTGRWGRRVGFTLDVGLAAPLELACTAKLNLPVHVATEGLSACVNEALATYEWNGKTATGISEFMGQLYA